MAILGAAETCSRPAGAGPSAPYHVCEEKLRHCPSCSVYGSGAPGAGRAGGLGVESEVRDGLHDGKGGSFAGTNARLDLYRYGTFSLGIYLPTSIYLSI